MKLRLAVVVRRRSFIIAIGIAFLACALLLSPPAARADEIVSDVAAAEPASPADPLYEGEQTEGGLLQGVLWYVPNRIYDFFDMFSLSLSAGPVAGYNVRITEEITGGVMELNAHRVGFTTVRL